MLSLMLQYAIDRDVGRKKIKLHALAIAVFFLERLQSTHHCWNFQSLQESYLQNYKFIEW